MKLRQYLTSEQGKQDIINELKERLATLNLPDSMEKVRLQWTKLDYIFNFDGMKVAIQGYIKDTGQLIIRHLNKENLYEESTFDLELGTVNELLDMLLNI